MDNQDLQKQLDEQQQALVKIFKSVEQTRKYMLWSGITSLVMFVIPLIIVVIALPKIIGVFTSSMDIFESVSPTSQSVQTGQSFSDDLKNVDVLFKNF